MKIVAVIPARAGSKRIPNKNVRLIGDRPLIYYAIQCAKESVLVTDIIVTSNSPDIAVIAKQMGIRFHSRPEELCDDDTPLDPVIYDAIQNIECDYVVTLQPTSPTLKPQTLDSAIRYCISKEFDSVVSVYNLPQLGWERHGECSLPTYSKRLNSQKMPPSFVETGAFLISKKTCVRYDSRLGDKVDVFEVSNDESLMIRDYHDLVLARAIMNKQSTAFFVHGNNEIGTGHIYRVLELADEMYCDSDIYYDSRVTDVSIFGQTHHHLISVEGITGLFEAIQGKMYKLFINDILSTNADFIESLRSLLPLATIVNFEDDGDGAYHADLVINALYNQSDSAHMKVGEKYFILFKQFFYYHPIAIKEAVETIFICFGGADPSGYTEVLLDIVIDDKYRKFNFLVVIGPAKREAERLLQFNRYPNIEVMHNVKNMPEYMSRCDIAVSSRGQTCFELASLGIPTISIAQNEREKLHRFVCHENGFNYLGLKPSKKIISSNLDAYIALSLEERYHYQQLLLHNDIKSGRRRVLNLIYGL
jgi:CMP-N-acetylneuraminic acid synthetase/spore coat polysaccharide biosynthesis predicted glycosyltransferase SpsG